jgi:hypothetical protein
MWAERIDLGFELPGAQFGQLGNSRNLERLSKLLKSLVDVRGLEPQRSDIFVPVRRARYGMNFADVQIAVRRQLPEFA